MKRLIPGNLGFLFHVDFGNLYSRFTHWILGCLHSPRLLTLARDRTILLPKENKEKMDSIVRSEEPRNKILCYLTFSFFQIVLKYFLLILLYETILS